MKGVWCRVLPRRPMIQTVRLKALDGPTWTVRGRLSRTWGRAIGRLAENCHWGDEDYVDIDSMG